MNCKKGDVAEFIVEGRGQIDGIEFRARKGSYVYILGLAWATSMKERSIWWRIEPARIRSCDGRHTASFTEAADRALRPIRPGDGEDEMLRIAGKPQQRDETLMPRKQMEHAR